MGYDLHITRADHWIDAETTPIPRDAWHAFASREPALVENGWVDFRGRAREPVFRLGGNDERAASSLYWYEGRIEVGCGPRADLSALARLAETLRARLQGDDGEVYDVDGTAQ